MNSILRVRGLSENSLAFMPKMAAQKLRGSLVVVLSATLPEKRGRGLRREHQQR